MSGRICPQCGTRYEGEQRFCPLDGATLVAEQRTDSLTGSVLADRYLVREKLGEGGMGEVYLAEHVRMKRKVAVKVMRKWLTSDPASIGRFHREAENASQISHPNVAAVYDFGETADGLVYLAMEFVRGESLTQILAREGALNHIRVSDIVSQIAEALHAAHALGILHRDLKPDNVMVGKTRVGTDQVKLLDFGIARVMGRDTQHFTSTGLIVGTPDWMSPEQISGDSLDARADIYALGLIAFRALAGEGAFGDGSSQDTLLAKMTKPPRRLSAVRPAIAWPDAVQAALDRALAGNPADRYGDALEFARAFFLAISQMPMTPEAETYLAALSQRSVTPVGGLGSVEPTPPRPVAGLTEETPAPARLGLSLGGATGATPVTPVLPVAAAATPPAHESVPAGAGTGVHRDMIAEGAAAIVSEADTAPVPMVALTNGRSAEAAAEAELSTAPTLEVEPDGGTATAGAEAGQPRGRGRGRSLLVGAAAAAAVAVTVFALLTKGSTGTANTPRTTVSDSTGASTAVQAPDSTANDTTSAGTALAMDSVVRQSARGVFAMGTDGGGAGFLADSTGIVLTAASLLPRQDTVSVLVDGAQRLLAPVLVRDAPSDVAAVLISMKACRQCPSLDFSEDSTAGRAGDSVAVIGAPSLVSSRRDARGLVSASTPARMTVALRAPSGARGGPMVDASGRVLAMAQAVNRSTVNGTPVAVLRGVLDRARTAARRVTAPDAEAPSWPARPVPNAALTRGRQRPRQQIDDQFLTTRDDFAVMVMTPQVLAWRRAAGDSLKKYSNPLSLSKENCSGLVRCDPLESWASWREYLDERRAVVIVQVSPKDAAPPEFGPSKTTFRRGSVGSFVITRNDTIVHPIESARIYAMLNPQGLPVEQRLYSGIYVFSPDDFLSARSIDITVTDEKNAGRTTHITLPPKLLDAVKSDLREFMTAGR